MLAESFFTEVILSYRSQLEESDLVASYESLRDYCKSRRVAWRNFVRRASTSEVACGLPLIASRKNSGKKSTSPDTASKIPNEPSQLLPLYFTSRPEKPENSPIDNTILLRSVKITFPGGIKVSIGEGSGREVLMIINGFNS